MRSQSSFMLKYCLRVWALCRSIQCSVFCGHSTAPDLLSLLLMYVLEEGRDSKAGGKSTTDFEKTNKQNSKHKSYWVKVSDVIFENRKKHLNELRLKVMGLPDNSPTIGKINTQSLNEAGYSTVKSGNIGPLRSSTVHMKVHSCVRQPFNWNVVYAPGSIFGAGDPN